MKWLQTITKLPILVKGEPTAEDGKNNGALNCFLLPFLFLKSMVNSFSMMLMQPLAIQAGAADIIAIINAQEEVSQPNCTFYVSFLLCNSSNELGFTPRL